MKFKKVLRKRSPKSFIGYYPSQYKTKNGKKLTYLEIKLEQRLLKAGFNRKDEEKKIKDDIEHNKYNGVKLDNTEI